jgi:hypothetical protein
MRCESKAIDKGGDDRKSNVSHSIGVAALRRRFWDRSME